MRKVFFCEGRFLGLVDTPVGLIGNVTLRDTTKPSAKVVSISVGKKMAARIKKEKGNTKLNNLGGIEFIN
jgi:hypothetical protein